MIPLADRPLFAVGATTYTWGDVVTGARRAGAWAEVERRAREGLDAQARAAALGRDVPADEVRAAERAFRYEHGLLSADEVGAWLERWKLRLEDWRGYLQRRLLRERLEADASTPGDGAPAAADAIWAEAVCSGDLVRLARALAARAAVWEVEAAGAAPLADPDRLEEVFARFCAGAASDRAVANEVERQRVEWVRLELETAAFADEEAAREAALCVSDDGLALAEAAQLAGVEVHLVRGSADELDPALSTALVSARPGDLVGPVPLEDGFALALLRSKRPPTSDDPDVRARAERTIALRAVAREERERVRWLEHV